MARTATVKRTQKLRKPSAKKSNLTNFFRQNHLSNFIAGFGGAAFGIALMLAIVLPMVRQQIQDVASTANHRVLAMQPASANLECTTPEGATNNMSEVPMVQTASATMPSSTTPVGGMGSEPTGSTGGNVITKIIGEYHTNNHAAISNTGADSINTISQTTNNTTTVSNTNDVSVVNKNPQTASSGSVNSAQNTTASSATSGDASNQVNTSFIFKVNN